ncbi:MAG: Bug family tripartite tricarboxylate transporter substrate binding protein [Burkholderiales bacterium]
MRKMSAAWSFGLCATVVALVFPAQSVAQTFPSKVVRIVNAQGPGTLDVLSRGYAQELSKYWGQPVVVEARPGAGSILGAEAVARSAPDGYTLLVSSSAAYTVNQWVTKNMPYDPEKDLLPVFGIGRSPSLVTLAASLPVKSVQDLVALARAKPGALNYGSAGIGSATHLQVEIFLSEMGGLKMLHVPYKGINDIVRGITAGEVQMGFSAVPLTIGAAKAGQVRAPVIIGERRDPSFPEVPTLREAGFPNSTGSIIWFGFALPIKTPQAIVDRIATDLTRASNEPTQKQILEKTGWELMLTGPTAFGDLVKRERAVIGNVVAEIGLRPD